MKEKQSIDQDQLINLRNYKNNFGIIVGVGSVGMRHLSAMKNFVKVISLVDKNTIKLASNKVHNGNTKFQKYNNIRTLSKKKNYLIGTISTWGPNHFSSIKKLIKLNVKKIIVEKPVVSKLKDISYLKEIKNHEIFVNIPFLYSGIAQKISQVSLKFGLGDILSINVIGGAKCISTSGIHYIALAGKLFGSIPKLVIANLSNTPGLNPRSDKLKYVEGQTLFKYSNNRSLIINYSNSGSLQEIAVIEFRFGRIFIENNLATIYKSSKKGKKTKTYYPEIFVNKFRVLKLENDQYLRNYYSKIIKNRIDSNFSEGLEATEILIAALISSKEKKTIKFPIEARFRTKYMNREWNIS